MAKRDYKAISLSYQPCNRPPGSEISAREWNRKQQLGNPNRKRKAPKTSPIVRTYAKRNRKRMTSAERRFKSALDLAKIAHTTQHCIGPFIADFAIPSKKLVIEIDGGYHRFNFAKDELRSRHLRRWGWTVLRFTNEQVSESVDRCIQLCTTAMANS